MKVITSDQLESIINAAHENSANGRGCRQRLKKEHAEIMRLLEECPGINVEPPKNLTDTYVVYVRTVNLGTKKWPDCYKAAEISGIIVKETEKMIYTVWGEHVRKDKILAIVC